VGTFSLGIKHIGFNSQMRRRREELGLTQGDIGDKLGVSGGLISRIETLRQPPSPRMRSGISEILGLNPDELFPLWVDEYYGTFRGETEHDVDALSLSGGEVLELSNNLDEESVQNDVFARRLYDEIAGVLPGRERKAVEMRYGIPDGDTYSFDEIGKEFRVTRERARQIVAKGLKRLQLELMSRGYSHSHTVFSPDSMLQ